MIVIGIDPHMKTHTAVALDAATGRSIATTTVACSADGHEGLLSWARRLGDKRLFAIEDCRHVSGRLERSLVAAGDRVVRVPPKLMAGASRFASESEFAMHVGAAPLPVSSGRTERHRLNRTGNRKLNSAIHMIAVTQARMYPPAMAYMERKRSEGMSNREALRCLKRHISRALFKTMLRAEQQREGRVVRVDFSPVRAAVAVYD